MSPTIREAVAFLTRRQQGISGATNKDFAATDSVFHRACELAGVKPTSRQASKFRNKKGKAYPFTAQAVRELSERRVANAQR